MSNELPINAVSKTRIQQEKQKEIPSPFQTKVFASYVLERTAQVLSLLNNAEAYGDQHLAQEKREEAHTAFTKMTSALLRSDTKYCLYDSRHLIPISPILKDCFIDKEDMLQDKSRLSDIKSVTDLERLGIPNIPNFANKLVHFLGEVGYVASNAKKADKDLLKRMAQTIVNSGFATREELQSYLNK